MTNRNDPKAQNLSQEQRDLVQAKLALLTATKEQELEITKLNMKLFEAELPLIASNRVDACW